MKQDFGWMKITRVWRNAVRALTKGRSVFKRIEQVLEKREVALNERDRESLSGACDATILNGEMSREIGLNSAENAEISAENALGKTDIKKSVSDNAQCVVNKADSLWSDAGETTKNVGGDGNEIESEPPRSTASATLNVESQVKLLQMIRVWRNREGKDVVQAALEVELSARSPEFVFLRTAAGALYRYPSRKLSLADRVWVSEALDVNVASEEVASVEVKGETSDALNDGGSDAFDFCGLETSQRLLEQEVGEDDEELRLDFWEENEGDAASLNASEEQGTSEGGGSEGDATPNDLRLDFWDDEDDVSDVSTNEKTSFDKETQPQILNDLTGVGERESRARRVGESEAREREERENERENEREDGAQRKKEKKRKSLKSSAAAYYELFSRMEPEALDGLLYDYCDNFDAIRDEIEAENIIDYYDWTYGDARYRTDDERE